MCNCIDSIHSLYVCVMLWWFCCCLFLRCECSCIRCFLGRGGFSLTVWSSSCRVYFYATCLAKNTNRNVCTSESGVCVWRVHMHRKTRIFIATHMHIYICGYINIAELTSSLGTVDCGDELALTLSDVGLRLYSKAIHPIALPHWCQPLDILRMVLRFVDGTFAMILWAM